ncbi:MAG TPA: LysM peptidoglycan-binding domain-containing protein [Blastocatellia bacterium]|nr:LysM peptidoglycan-binding domain-containing protein [Blastocatellia bacterium]HMV87837.1 LysM peptidoglycan-binding domain-containing protein [Blastocatellia bacterium]HMX26818.1 LysM peptidoglycan-binding domain-containing protein [Blastocatellia bacterium]HMY71581.1 LysM peptidoglycan-binding domain-containing protein [Blastocatellia bacterium]HMZ19915.1 LysM peptidoglycan-binding domain-containing protein [Blastocatellia bacterium]
MASFDELKSKYNAVLEKGHEIGLTVQNLNLEGDKLLIRGVVPSDYAKNEIWDTVKSIDAGVSDAIIDVNVQSGLTYTVVSGDTLSKIAKRFYGDANHYHEIAKASGIDNPDRINVGQTITLP